MTIESSFAGSGGRTIYTRHWLPEGEARDHVVIVHGFGEHIARYDHVAAFLVARGYAVHGLDHQGHGRSEGDRAVIRSFDEADDDIDVLVDRVRRESKLDRIKLIGHSMGGSLALNYALNHQLKLSGLVLSGPAIGGGVSMLLGIVLKLISAIAPRTGMVQLDAEAVSRDPEVVAAYRNDPLVHHGKVPARTANEMMKAIERYKSEAQRLVIPCLLMHGMADTLVPADDARPIFAAIGSPDKTIRVLPGLYHEIFNEPEQDEVLGEVADWLDAHLPG